GAGARARPGRRLHRAGQAHVRRVDPAVRALGARVPRVLGPAGRLRLRHPDAAGRALARDARRRERERAVTLDRETLADLVDALIAVRDSEESLREIYPSKMHGDPAWNHLREYFCPGCKTLLEVEAVPPGYPVIHDFVPDLEGFYEGWLERELPRG